jgi:hypothetical protein
VKQIPLTKGKEALVDDQDYTYLMQWPWSAIKNGKYAVRYKRLCDKDCASVIYMHDVVAARSGLIGKVDHINRNSLDNQRANFRLATNSQNLANRGPQTNNTTGYKGVVWDRQRCRWIAQIKVRMKHIFLGRYDIKIEAAKAYNEAATKYFGEFAYLNEVPECQ